MSKFKTILVNLLSDESNSISHKRVLAMLGSFCLFISLFLNIILKIDPSDKLVDAVLYLTLFAMGYTTIDKFSKK
jgi:hypothetical protein